MTAATSCSEGNRRTNLQQCLLDIQAAGNNNSAFWFGTQYSTTCPNGDDGTLVCFNRDPTAQTLFQRMQLSPGFDPSVIDRFLKVEFTSPPGRYTFQNTKRHEPQNKTAIGLDTSFDKIIPSSPYKVADTME